MQPIKQDLPSTFDSLTANSIGINEPFLCSPSTSRPTSMILACPVSSNLVALLAAPH